MAKLTNTGIAEAESELQRIEKGLRGEAMLKALNAGADVLIQAWKDEIGERHRKTSQRDVMSAAVTKTDVRFGNDGASIEVYPQGTDKEHHITNAAKAFILHYGRDGKRQIKGDKFVKIAEHRRGDEALAAVQKVIDEYVSGKG